MKRGEVRLTMRDGSTRTICTAGAREIRLTDRAFAHLQAVIQNRRLRPAPRLDRELIWLREAVKIEGPEPDAKFFSETKDFITDTLDKIETKFNRSMKKR